VLGQLTIAVWNVPAGVVRRAGFRYSVTFHM
jgi:hypothetical protein